jgi:MFS family permease
MLRDTNLLERHIFRRYWDDGQLDLFAAAGVFLIGLFWLRSLPAGAAIVPALMVPLWQPLRRRLVEPRMGRVEFTNTRDQQNRRALKFVMYGGIAVLILGIEVYFFRDSLPVSPSLNLIAGLPAFILAVLAVAASVLVGSARFLLHAAVLVVAGASGALLGWRPGTILAFAGTAMLVIAGIVIARFMKSSPVDAGEED